MRKFDEHNSPADSPTKDNLTFRKNRSSGGPKTAAGKRRVRLNALTHGFFTHELVVKEIDKAEFDALREAIRTQLRPTTTMRSLACDRVVTATWRFKLALRMEMERIRTTNPENEEDLAGKPSFEQESPWYLSGRSGLNMAQKMLNELREEIAKNGDLHLDESKVWIQKTFGASFYDTLAEWQPVSPDSILGAEHMAAHAEQFKRPLPEIDQSKRDEALLAYGRARWEMILKLIDLKSQHIAALFYALNRDADTVSQPHTLAIDAISRHITSAARELERSIDWYRYLLDKGL